jgi:hypothetical protein
MTNGNRPSSSGRLFQAVTIESSDLHRLLTVVLLFHWSEFEQLQRSNNDSQIRVYHTTDKGEHWQWADLPTTEPWEKDDIAPENVFASFHPAQEMPSWILLTTEPALGWMGKRLYREKTDHDEKESFHCLMANTCQIPSCRCTSVTVIS